MGGKLGGAASWKVCERAAEALEIILASGKGDGLGYAIAGGLNVLEPLCVAQRQAAVKAARSEANKACHQVCRAAAQALGLFKENGEADSYGYRMAGGLAVLEFMTLEQRIDAVAKAKIKNNAIRTEKKEVIDFQSLRW